MCSSGPFVKRERAEHATFRTDTSYKRGKKVKKKRGITYPYPPPSQILEIFIPIDSSSLTDYISEKIFRRSRLVRALGRLKVF